MKKFVVFMLALLFILPINNVHAQREVTISLDGKTITADAKPYIKNDRTMVPIRLISESLGYKVNWDEANRQVKVEKADKSLLITIDKKEYLLNGEKKKSDVAAEITKDRTFVPIRLIAESLGENVSWDPNTYTVIIKTSSNLDAEAKQLEDIAKGFQKNITELRSYYFENASKYTQDQQIAKLEEVTEDGVVKVSFSGGCKGCSLVNITLKDGIEANLKQAFPGMIKEVIDTTNHEVTEETYK